MISNIFFFVIKILVFWWMRFGGSNLGTSDWEDWNGKALRCGSTVREGEFLLIGWQIFCVSHETFYGLVLFINSLINSCS